MATTFNMTPEVMEILKKAAAAGLLTETGNIRKDVREQVKITKAPTTKVRVAKSIVATVIAYCANPTCRTELGEWSEGTHPVGSTHTCPKCGDTNKVGKRLYSDQFRLGFGDEWKDEAPKA